ncbi:MULTISPECIES: hypothetical protein [unclassified Treponema]|uniref:hypothetical protein n=1 Tax=unclassified Treponema TaxID=2638727 RepID=UPI0020A36078|nr:MULTISPECIES: hypothetical protein [unclassified Treponema]UTC65998.1 hypothetical protein E4O06_08170 [Treponema sp. OMZ 789]UTC68728.1 hypothetical protein E4O01_08310 [Treponema sp. OMZ 790]UTC71457.1 hypothetical protein E4O02_08500 [Treponema sp. OMZ 791]
MPKQLEFDFSELPETKTDLPHYKNPKCDNERLLNYQWDFKHGDKAALNKMYKLGLSIALRYISTHAKKNPHIARLDKSYREEKAHNAITYIIARYLQVSDFVISKSFTSYLYLRIQHELFYRRKVDSIIDFVDLDSLYPQK